MPVIKPKTPEVLQAQAAAFSAECPGYGDGQDLVREIGNASVGMEVALDTPPSQRRFEPSSREKEYVEFLRKSGGQQSPLVAQRAEMLEEYERFEPTTGRILRDLEDVHSTNWYQHPAYMGKGSTSVAFKIEVEGEEYALRVPKKEGSSLDRRYVTPAVKAAGDDSMEQMTAISYEAGVTISEIMPGRDMTEVSPEELASATDEQLGEYAETLAAAQRAGLVLDPNPSNVLYDAENGFGVIDLIDIRYRELYKFEVGSGDLSSVLNAGADAILFPKHMAEARIEKTHGSGPEANKAMRELYDLYIPIMSRYRAECTKRFADHKSLALIEMRLGQQLTSLMRYRRTIPVPDAEHSARTEER